MSQKWPEHNVWQLSREFELESNVSLDFLSAVGIATFVFWEAMKSDLLFILYHVPRLARTQQLLLLFWLKDIHHLNLLFLCFLSKNAQTSF